MVGSQSRMQPIISVHRVALAFRPLNPPFVQNSTTGAALPTYSDHGGRTVMNKSLLVIAAAVSLYAGDRFDMQVRGDFFAGFSGNREAMARAMTNAEYILAANP